MCFIKAIKHWWLKRWRRSQPFTQVVIEKQKELERPPAYVAEAIIKAAPLLQQFDETRKPSTKADRMRQLTNAAEQRRAAEEKNLIQEETDWCVERATTNIRAAAMRGESRISIRFDDTEFGFKDCGPKCMCFDTKFGFKYSSPGYIQIHGRIVANVVQHFQREGFTVEQLTKPSFGVYQIMWTTPSTISQNRLQQ